MKTFNLKKTFLVTAFALCSTSVTAPAISGNLQSELNDLFGTMSNVTQPGVYETTRRGVIAGGGANVRSRRMNIQLVSFEPPNIKGGCGGIDVFLGSFSYINLDQFISFLRAIAANAAGYAFQMALKVSCGVCSNVMEAMQTLAQRMNNMNMSSCQLAEGLVTDTYAALQGKTDFTNTIKNVKEGLSLDTNEDKSGATQGQEKAFNANPQKYTEEQLGNIVWKALRKNDVNLWFGLSNNELSMMEALMSITGTVVLEKAKPGVTPLIFPKSTYDGGLVTMRDLIEGSMRDPGQTNSVDGKMYSCESDKIDCMTPKEKRNMNIRGLAQIIQDALLQDEGIIAKYARDRGDGLTKMTPQQAALLSNMPPAVSKALRDMSLGSEMQARVIAPAVARTVALQMTYDLMKELLRAVKTATNGLSDEHSLTIKPLILESEKRIHREYEQLLGQYGSEVSLVARMNGLIQMMEYESPILANNPRVQTFPLGSSE